MSALRFFTKRCIYIYILKLNILIKNGFYLSSFNLSMIIQDFNLLFEFIQAKSMQSFRQFIKVLMESDIN